MIRVHVEGAVVDVAAQAGSRRERLVGRRGEALRIAVSARPERGRANAAIASVLGDALGCRPSEIRLLSGSTHRMKRYLIVGRSPEEVQGRLEALLSDSADSDKEEE